MKQKIGIGICLIIFLAPLASAAVQPIFIFGFGGGYGLLTDSYLKSSTYIFDTLIDFKEKHKLKNQWSVNIQGYVFRDFGIELEYTAQAAEYFSDLKWYGWWDTSGFMPEYIPINHFEEPMWTRWTLKSFIASFLIGGERPFLGGIFPYATAGIGRYWTSGDQTQFLNRSRLGGSNKGLIAKISVGVRQRILPVLGINLRVSGQTAWKNSPRMAEKIEMGPDQFDLGSYYRSGQIIRSASALTQTFTTLSVELNLEFIFKWPQKKEN